MKKLLGRFGSHGETVSVRVVGDRVVALWRVHGVRTRKTWANTPAHRKEAVAWAETFAATRFQRKQAPALVTTGQLWERYAAAEFPVLRPRSQKLYAEYWRRWATFATPESIAEDLGAGTVAAFRAQLETRERKLAPSTIGQTIQIVKVVYAWGARHGLLARNGVREFRYKVAKEQRLPPPEEYRGDDLAALLAQLPLDRATTWRAHAALALCGNQGARQNAVLHLRWEDVDLEGGLVTWRARWDKTGREWTQPLRDGSIVVLRAAWERTGPAGWVFPSGSGKSRRPTYSPQSLWAALRRAEEAAGIAHRPRRAAHGLRRMVFNDVMEVTGDVAAAMAAIHDTDLRVASRYVKGRDDRVRAAFRALDEAKGPRNATAPETNETTGVD
jgi:integrase/recombinase XerC